MERYSFRNDYSELAHTDVLKALMSVKDNQYGGYGLDVHSENAVKLIKKVINREDVDIHFIGGGTQANLVVLSAILRSHEAVIACETGHIATHETGAIEATGHKVCTVKTEDGKLRVEQIEEILKIHQDEHMVKPKAVFISLSTEIGTIYTKKELQEIHTCCRDNDLYLYMDGARIAAGINSKDCDLTYEDIANLVDVFYFGGTKNGALFGEAIVICNDGLKTDFRYSLKQRGGMLAKGAALGIQFEALFTNNLYDNNAVHANTMAYRLADGIRNLGYEFLTEVQSNQIFPIFPNGVVEGLKKKYEFHEWVNLGEKTAIRLVTSFATPVEVVDTFIAYLSSLTGSRN